MNRSAMIAELNQAEVKFRENVAVWRTQAAQARTEAGACADALAEAERVAAEARRRHQAAEDRVHHAEQRVRELHGQHDHKIATLRRRLIESAPAPVAEYLNELRDEVREIINRKPYTRSTREGETMDFDKIAFYSNSPNLAARREGLQNLLVEAESLLATEADADAILLALESKYATLADADAPVVVGFEDRLKWAAGGSW